MQMLCSIAERGSVGDNALPGRHEQSLEFDSDAGRISLEVSWYYGRKPTCALCMVSSGAAHLLDSLRFANDFHCLLYRQYIFVNGFLATKMISNNSRHHVDVPIAKGLPDVSNAEKVQEAPVDLDA